MDNHSGLIDISESITIEFQMIAEDFSEFQWFHMRKINFVLKSSLIVCLIVFFAWYGSFLSLDPDFIITLIMVGVGSALYHIFFKPDKKYLAKFKPRVVAPFGFGIMKYILNDSGISTEYKTEFSNTNSLILWDKIYSIRESKNALYVYITKDCAQILPKRAISGKESEIISLIRKKVDSEKIHLTNR